MKRHSPPGWVRLLDESDREELRSAGGSGSLAAGARPVVVARAPRNHQHVAVRMVFAGDEVENDRPEPARRMAAVLAFPVTGEGRELRWRSLDRHGRRGRGARERHDESEEPSQGGERQGQRHPRPVLGSGLQLRGHHDFRGTRSRRHDRGNVLLGAERRPNPRDVEGHPKSPSQCLGGA